MDTPPPSHNQKPTLEQLLRRGDVWRGHSQVFSPREAIATGHAALDARLVNRGWPLGSLVEVCLPEAFKRDGCFGGEWLLLSPVVNTLCGAETFLILLNPPAQPFASGLIQAGVPLDQVLVIRAESRQDFIASFVELSRSQYCAILLAWQPRQNLSYTELRKCQLACAPTRTKPRVLPLRCGCCCSCRRKACGWKFLSKKASSIPAWRTFPCRKTGCRKPRTGIWAAPYSDPLSRRRANPMQAN